MYKVISFSEWAQDTYNSNKMMPHTPNMIILHHTYKPESKYTGANIVRNIRDYHIKQNGFDEIGYHYIGDANGIFYKGREDNHVGAHCIPNTGKIGICLIGNYDKELLSAVLYKNLIELVSNLCIEYNIKTYDIRGHRDFDDKSCPGDNIYDILPDIRDTVEGYL